MSPTEEKLPPPQYMELAARKIRNAYGLPGSGQKEREATLTNFLSLPYGDVLQNAEAQSKLVGLLAEVIDAGRWDVFSTIVLTRMTEDDPDWGQHPIARLLYESPTCKKEFKEKVLDKLPSAWRKELEKYRYEVYRETEYSSRLTEYGIFEGALMSTS
ncbi:MAG: hypothetical protein LBH53_00755 [Puniceicoccales bacterium]|jgi:hypothetical protein|nr:hypothetical protein [Puniceicoccales bacterium]